MYMVGQGMSHEFDTDYRCGIVSEHKFVLLPPIAQLVEQIPFKDKVPGSSPGGRTIAQKTSSLRTGSFL